MKLYNEMDGVEKMKCRKNDCFTCPYPDCINESIPHQSPLSDSSKARLSQKGKARCAAFKTAGLCTSCGKRVPEIGYKRCHICRSYDRRKKKEYRLRDGKMIRELMDGVALCMKCGKNEPASGYRMCELCLSQARAALDKTPTHNGGRIQSGFTEEHEKWWQAARS